MIDKPQKLDEERIAELVREEVAKQVAALKPSPPKMVPLWPGGPLAEASGPTVRQPPIPRETDPAVLAIGRQVAEDVRAHAASSKTDWGVPANWRAKNDPTPEGISVGRPGGPMGPELDARELATRKNIDGIAKHFDERERSPTSSGKA